MNIQEIRNIFDNSQHLHKHQRCLKQMQDLYHKYISCDELLESYKAELRRNILFTLNNEPKSPFTKHTIDFIALFLKSVSQPVKDTTQSADNTAIDGADGDTTIIDEQMAADESTQNRSDQENTEPANESAMDDELGMESFGSESFTRKDRSSVSLANTSIGKEEPTFADVVVKEFLLRFLQNIKSIIRYNCCVLVRKLFTDLEDMDLDVYKQLKLTLFDRLRDKDKTIRSVAALALHRFQDPNESPDLVSDALKFHLRHDPDFRVRQSCLLSLHPTLSHLDEFINATRDVKDIIRKTAFILIAEKFSIKSYGIDKRLQILRNGLNERHVAVKKVVETKLLPIWVKTYDFDFEALLYALDIQSDPELIERMLYLYFDYINKDLDESTEKTGFHRFLDEFSDTFLVKDKNLLTKVMLTTENAFLWRIVAKYCKDKDITITLVKDNNSENNTEDMSEADSQPTEPNEERVEAIDTIVPDLPHYCHYIEIFIRNLMANEYQFNELMEFEFMFKQLLLMGELIEIGDEAQREILRKCLTQLLNNEELFLKINDYIKHLMKIFAQNSDLNVFIQTTVELMDSINSKAIEVDEVSAPPLPPAPVVDNTAATDEQMRQMEVDYARLNIRHEQLKDDLLAAQSNDNESEADRITDLMEEYKNRMDEMLERRLKINACQLAQSSQQSSQPTQNNNSEEFTLTTDPIAIGRCLQIFNGCVQYADLRGMNPLVLKLYDRFIMSNLPNQEMRIRSTAIRGVGLCCLISPEFSRKYFWIFIQVLNVDSGEAAEMALNCAFDTLCMHGLAYFEHKSKPKANESKQNKSLFEDISENKENRSNNSVTIEGEEAMDDDNERTVINEDNGDVLCSDSEGHESEEEEESEESFISLFTDLLERHLISESETLRYITVQGIAKLFILGRMYSPQLLSKLIILWYDSDSSEEMRQFLGVFLPIYSNVEMKANLKGENAFEECFIKTVETVYDKCLRDINLDNLINFMVELISDDGHKNLAKSVANQILTRMLANGVDDTLSNKYYLRVLSVLRLTEMSTQDVKEYKLLMKKIDRNVNKMKIKTKLTTNRLQTIKSKIDKQIDLIKQNTTQLSSLEDFGSLTLSQSLSQSLSERSQIEETFIETNE